MYKVAVVMGSKSDFEAVKPALKALKKFDVPFFVRVLSAHRTPDEVHELVNNAEKENVGVFIAAAGKAAHLAGVIAGLSTLPVIGIPMKSSTLDGLDSLLSVVQMPSGVPVATVAIGGSENAGILAAQILALGDKQLAQKLKDYKKEMQAKVLKDDAGIQDEIANI
ncbi:MAG: 5-(carboxyamino)imidazole ribonucleotide mutase [Clostridia bacterium]|nr:5-(carboxyamino)imidazole ribonucleotide mutase [Clostridia bacterium]MBR2303431.1 5-(carboxyamino)imidazole ribonucleotide mutase [Clostridia bacterium]